MNAKNGDLGVGAGAGAGAAGAAAAGAAADGEQVREHLRAAREAAAQAARARAQQARDWASSQMGDLREQIETQPYRASAWALGLGFVAGIVLMGLLRSNRR